MAAPTADLLWCYGDPEKSMRDATFFANDSHDGTTATMISKTKAAATIDGTVSTTPEPVLHAHVRNDTACSISRYPHHALRDGE